MYHLIPRFIHNRVKANCFDGSFRAATMFIDISGFTGLTQVLMEHGKRGAEMLSQIMNQVFEPVIHTVYEQGGFISGFAGDAFTAIFDDPLAACLAAQTIRQHLMQQQTKETSFGHFSLAMKIGLAYGLIEWGVIGLDEQIPDLKERSNKTHVEKSYFFRGVGIRLCSGAEQRARRNEIVLHKSLLSMLPMTTLFTQPLDSNYVRLHGMMGISNSIHTQAEKKADVSLLRSQSNLDLAVASQFFDQSLFFAAEQGEFRNVACVFISFEEENAAQFQQFVQQTLRVTNQFGGYFNKVHFGDKGGTILIVFGAPITYEDNLERTLDFILSWQNELKAIKGLDTLKWRAGLGFGLVYAGMVGIPMRSEYTVLGHAINLAARLMIKAKWGQILAPPVISQKESWRGKRAYLFSPVGKFKFKGILQPIPTYELAGQLQHKKEGAWEGETDQPMVGRRAELELLQACIEPIFDNSFAGVALIYGEAGIGKSRLSTELRRHVHHRSELLLEGIKWYIAPSDPILRQAFNPFVYFLKSYFQQSLNASAEDNKALFLLGLDELLERLKIRMGIAASASLRHELMRTQSILGALMGLYWPNSLYEQLDAKARYQNTLSALRTLLLAESRLQPIVLQLEDAHWMDESSRDFLISLTRQITGYPIFIICNARYEDDGGQPIFPFDRQTKISTINLHPISGTELRLFAENYLDGVIHDRLYEILLEKTEGNPFYIEQFLYYFSENNLLVFDIFAWRLANEEELDLPANLNTLLMARVDRLPPEIKRIVKIAAVLGREFEVRVLSEMLQYDLLPQIHAAEQEQIWAPLSTSRYLFKNSLLRDVLYESQLHSALRDLHKLAATTIEQLYGSNLHEHYASLAYHYRQALQEPQEKLYTILAAKQAMDKFANAQAVRYLSRALELTEDQEVVSRYRLLLKREGAYDLLGQRDAQQNDLTSLSMLADRLDDNERRAESAIRHSRYGERVSDYSIALSAAEEAMRLAQLTKNKTLLAEAHLQYGKSVWPQGKYHEARGKFFTALALYRDVNCLPGESNTLTQIGITLFEKGEYAAGDAHLQQALTIRRMLNDRRGEYVTLINLGAACDQRGAYEEAKQYQQLALPITREVGDRLGESVVLINLASIYYHLQAYQDALACSQEVFSVTQQIGNLYFQASALTVLGHAQMRLNMTQQAAFTYQQAILLWKQMGLTHHILDPLAGLARISLKQGEILQAKHQITEILAYLNEHPMLDGTIEPLRIYFTCYQVLQANQDPRAEEILQSAYRVLQQRAEKISNEEMRNIFLTRVAAHQNIIQAWQRKH